MALTARAATVPRDRTAKAPPFAPAGLIDLGGLRRDRQRSKLIVRLSELQWVVGLIISVIEGVRADV
jgi:hypothetical protein